ncbi:Hsp20/alpha crystallin family protein [Sphingobacterium paludis]|uniref:HSP20 family protein n=1 Tax=Sphingobacterium paludis TaxID=1476465 RepID=A0A4R7D9Z6_9SPHI|nr:Hsp20/alpha crystallin family protein [Sphingobacterium paludis]TDS17617.1 HSP20 family protein [Sphingobacterium paludis]
MFKRDQHIPMDQHRSSVCNGGFRERLERIQKHLFDMHATAGDRTPPMAKSEVPVNILEHPEYFEVQLFAAGRKKELFTVAIENATLYLSYDEPTDSDPLHFSYQEYAASSFRRAFKLDEHMLTDNVQASFEEGVLTVILPKNPEAIKPARVVTID